MKKKLSIFLTLSFLCLLYIYYDYTKNQISYHEIKYVKICKLPSNSYTMNYSNQELLKFAYSDIDKRQFIKCIKEVKTYFSLLTVWKGEIPLVIVFNNGDTKVIRVSVYGDFYSVGDSYFFKNKIPKHLSNDWSMVFPSSP